MLHTAPAVTSTHMLTHAHTPALILPSFHTVVEDSASRIVVALLFLANYQCQYLHVVISLSFCPSATPSRTTYLSFLSGRWWGIDWNKGFGGKGESDSLIVGTLMNFIDQYLEFCHFHCNKTGDVRHPKSPLIFIIVRLWPCCQPVLSNVQDLRLLYVMLKSKQQPLRHAFFMPYKTSDPMMLLDDSFVVKWRCLSNACFLSQTGCGQRICDFQTRPSISLKTSLGAQTWTKLPQTTDWCVTHLFTGWVIKLKALLKLTTVLWPAVLDNNLGLNERGNTNICEIKRLQWFC